MVVICVCVCAHVCVRACMCAWRLGEIVGTYKDEGSNI